MVKIELEQKLEDRCAAKIEARGGLALKLSIPGVRGFPDRTILLDGMTLFAEFKRLKTGRISKQQELWAKRLGDAGFGVYFIDTDQQFDDALSITLATRRINSAVRVYRHKGAAR